MMSLRNWVFLLCATTLSACTDSPIAVGDCVQEEGTDRSYQITNIVEGQLYGYMFNGTEVGTDLLTLDPGVEYTKFECPR